jgi:hypothetical protein
MFFPTASASLKVKVTAVVSPVDNVVSLMVMAIVGAMAWSDNGRASDVVITGLDSFTLTSNGAVFGTDNIIHSTAIANTWIIGATDSGFFQLQVPH